VIPLILAVVPSLTSPTPRDNVVFEAGYFMRSKGSSRVLIVRENEAKMPADLGGTIYAALPDRKNIVALHEPLRKFINAALRR
jgi:predicted nucleotide-binding protein